MSTLTPKIVGRRDGMWVSFHGTPSQIMARGADTLGTYDVTRGKSASGSGAPPHVHAFDEGFYMLGGEMTFHAGNESVHLERGDFINIRGGTAHFPENESKAPADVLVVCAPAGFADFQIAVGERAAGPDGPFAEAPPDFLERMTTAGRDFGIDLEPSPTLFQQAPEMAVRRRGEGRCLATVGDVYTFLVTGEDTAGRYALWHALVYPGGGTPLHRHSREEEAFFILKGELSIVADAQPNTACEGDWIILPRHVAHSFKNKTDQPVEMLFLVAPAGLEKMFEETGTPWLDHRQAPPLPDPAEIPRLSKVAGRFGIEILPPAKSCSHEVETSD
jgi:quercetin dioxygenase-like cupin family protein